MSRNRRLLVLAICCLSLFVVGLDVTVVNIALPAIRRDLHASVSGLQWTVDAYTLVLASFLMLAGSTGDRVGRRRTFQVGLATFTLGSLLCSLAPSLGALIAFRMLQAAGGAMLNPLALSIITNTITDARERAQAIGIWAGVFGISMALGPVLGGLLVATIGWRSVFWINLPVGVCAIILTALFVPESRAEHSRRPDPGGQALVIVMLVSLTYAIIEGPRQGWLSVPIVSLFAVSAIALAGLTVYERHRDEPLLDLRFFGSVPFSGAVAIAVTAFASFGGFLLLTTLYLQDARGLSALRAGVFMLPLGCVSLVVAPLAGRIVGRWGTRMPLLAAGVLMTAGAALLTGLTATTAAGWLVLAFAVFGMGYGLVNAPITNTAVSGMPRAQAGVAAAVASTSRQVGQSLGVAVTGSVLNSALHGPFQAGFVAASRPAWWIVASCGAAVFMIGAVTSSRWARSTAAATAARLMAGENPPPAATPPEPGRVNA